MTLPEDSLAAGRLVYQGSRFDVRQVMQTGTNGVARARDVVVHPGAVVILPWLDAKTIVLIRNQRIAVGQTLWELPAGTLEPPPEVPETCAARELVEETGYRAGRIVPLTMFYSSPGICTERMFCFAAYDLTLVGQELDDGETITPEPIPIGDALEMVRDGRIRDGKTIATLLWHLHFADIPPDIL